MSANIIAQLDAEIAALQQARSMLSGLVTQKAATKRRKKHRISAEGRARIVAALKRRWAAKKKSR